MPRGRRRLFWRIYLHGVALLLLVLVALLVLGHLLGGGPAWKRHLQTFGPYFAAMCSEGGEPGEAVAVELQRYAGQRPLPVTCYSAEGRRIRSFGRAPQPPVEPEVVARLRREGIPQHVLGPHRLAVPLPAADGAAGEIWRYAVIGLQDPAIHAVPRLVVALAVVLGVLALGSIPLVRTIVAPVERLTQTTRAVARGELDARTGVRRKDELGRLAESFDEMLDRLQQLMHSERELLANVSHELRTPLSRIRVALELAGERSDGERRYLTEIGTDLGELERLIEDLLTTTRLDLAAAGPGAPPLRRARVRPRELVEQALERLSQQAAPLAVEVEVIGDPPAIEVDPMLIRRVLENLLRNAAQHGGEAGPIRVRLVAEQRAVSFEVQDRGAGVAAEDLPRLFEPFFRADRSRARSPAPRSGGVGLGLTLCRRIVEAHGGTIAARSTPGQGTTIAFSLPLRAS